MKKTIPLSLLVLFIPLTLWVWAGHSHAAPARQTNLLQNPGFEQPFNDGAAQGWQTWHILTPKEDDECLIAYHYRPKWGVETASGFVHEGAASQYIGNNWDTWAGGVYQTVPATPGTTYRFSFAGRGRGSSVDSPSPSETHLQINMRAGIDPNGGGAWNDADVVWGAAGSPHDTWQTFTVEAQATGNQITVFTAANWGVTGVNQCRQFLDTWYDAAQLVAQAPPTATAAPPTAAVATATFIPAPTGGVPTERSATDTPQPTATPAGRSSICVNAFLDNNGNGVRDADEGYVSGATLTVAQGATIIGQAVSTGGETPICFETLLPGEYQIAQSLPATLEATTQSNATVNLGEGQNIGLEFGSRPRATAVAEATLPAVTPTLAAPGTVVEPADGGSNWLIFLGLGAVLIGIALLGALLFMLLRR